MTERYGPTERAYRQASRWRVNTRATSVSLALTCLAAGLLLAGESWAIGITGVGAAIHVLFGWRRA